MKTEYLLKTIEEYTEEKSYSHKPHLAELPHDRRTNDPKLLQERIDAINEELEQAEEMVGTELWVQEERQRQIDELTQQNKEWKNQIEQMETISNKFKDYNAELKPKALEQVDKILDELDKALENKPLGSDPWAGQDANYYLNDPRRIKEMFQEGGLLTSQQANLIRGMVNSISIRTGDDPSFRQVKNDLDALADLCDINSDTNEDASGLLAEYYEFDGGPSYLQGKIDHNNKEIKDREGYIKDSKKEQRHWETVVQDYKDEKKRTETKLKEVKKD